ncbi:RICIN domain-containing protein [Streptomyces hiroshimensis]|uniref:RICIN domain-containing protein n=1 Tax=Streptomyces hiroshimensis TaxID=66424 RepID=UPI00167A1228|nr:RICIN domain-containing protein [Streptomyces hiroshimensis]
MASTLGATAPAASATPASAATAAGLPIPGVHYLRPAHAPDKCVTVHGWDNSTSALIDQWTCARQDNQRWNFLTNGPRYWVKSESSNKCLDGKDIKQGRHVIQWPCKNGLNQAWNPVRRILGDGSDTWEIHVGTMCLDVAGAGKGNGARLILWKCTSAANQRFYMD